MAQVWCVVSPAGKHDLQNVRLAFAVSHPRLAELSIRDISIGFERHTALGQLNK